MGTVPATGTEVSMGRISVVLGLAATPGSVQVGLNSTLGVGRNRSYSGVASIASGSETLEGGSFGGLSGSGTY
jgi:hypothetical protein